MVHIVLMRPKLLTNFPHCEIWGRTFKNGEVVLSVVRLEMITFG
jgi:hypothetical protein